jgi:hypothetical protein
MKVIICVRHLACIYRKWWRGVDYTWHVQHFLREFGLGQYAQLDSASMHELMTDRSNAMKAHSSISGL